MRAELQALLDHYVLVVQSSSDQWNPEAERVVLSARAALARPDPTPEDERRAQLDRLMELATDFAVESLRLGSHEARENPDRWKVVAIREKREAARERLRQALAKALRGDA
jgi:hypothetical protein